MRALPRVGLLVAYAALCGLLLRGFDGYLHRPRRRAWDEAHAFLRAPGRYRDEPVRFSPSWLRNYATDYSRFKGMDFTVRGDPPVYWRLATKEAAVAGYEVAERRELEGLVVEKLVRRPASGSVDRHR